MTALGERLDSPAQGQASCVKTSSGGVEFRVMDSIRWIVFMLAVLTHSSFGSWSLSSSPENQGASCDIIDAVHPAAVEGWMQPDPKTYSCCYTGKGWTISVLTTAVDPRDEGTAPSKSDGHGGVLTMSSMIYDDRLCSGDRRYGGNCHYSLTRSYLTGMVGLGLDFTFNGVPVDPRDGSNVCTPSDVIWVLSDDIDVEAVLDFRPRLLVLGPTVNATVMDPRLLKACDIFIVPSLWVKEYVDMLHPILRGKTRVLAAGVDETFWKPSIPRDERDTVLVYDKRRLSEEGMDDPDGGDDGIVSEVLQVLYAEGMDVNILRYAASPQAEGYHTKREYRQALSNARMAVFLSASESQGLALAEAWAMDVHTLVWDGPVEQLGGEERISFNSDSAPYLTAATGTKVRSVQELQKEVRRLNAQEGGGSSPREWVLRRMTDKASAHLLLQAMQCSLDAKAAQDC